MSRLIDADAFRRILREIQTDAEHFDNEQRRNDMGSIMTLLDKEPTAFDTEKVVEQLESLSNAEADYYYARSNDVIDREDAIDIVKKGGLE